MNPFRSVGALLSIALSLVVVGALLIIYFMVVPSLQHRLVDTRLEQLERAAADVRSRYQNSATRGDIVSWAAARTDARVATVEYLTSGYPNVLAYSLGVGKAPDLSDDPVALRTRATTEIQHGTVIRQHRRFAEVGIPVPAGNAIMLIASLAPQYQTIHVVKRRLLIAGLVGLLVALGVGYGGAWAFARRIKRLERAADRISSGQFDEPIVDQSLDELGELARAFDRMRLRLAQLDDVRREFIANASHELRTPLFSLGGFLELMDDEDLDEATRHEFLAAMREQVARLTRLATDLLDLSRLDAGRIRVESEVFDLEPVAQTVADEFNPVALANDHLLEVEPGNGGARAVGDPERVLQIGRLLVENAIVHTPAGTPVRLRVHERFGRAVLAVEDEGPGIPEAHVQQVFERFYRAEGGRTSGSGLGLAIARELAVLMGGTIEVDSRPGRTVFSLALPSPDGGEDDDEDEGEAKRASKFPRGTSLSR